MMEIIPAIDVKDGKCVRLRQGREDSGTVYAEDPVGVALRWVGEGAKRLHLVNLDGAFGHDSKATDILRSVASLTGVKVQFGGGAQVTRGDQKCICCRRFVRRSRDSGL